MTMQVPGHVVSMYVATCGKNGPDLGSDEKEIILLVYVVIDAATAQIVAVKQYLVRPTGRPGLERSISQQSATCGGGNQPNNIISTSTSSLSSSTSSVTITTTTTTNTIESTSILVNNNNNNNVINNNINNITTNNNLNNNNNTPLDIQQQQQQQQPQQQQQTQSNNATVVVQNTELPIALAQAAGKPLNEAIEQFDEYIRSLSIDPNSTTNFKLITDGQLPLRQCLHPEASAKDIELPSYYCKFSDLRKEYVRHKSADLSRALVPVKDVKKLPHMPPLPPPPLSIGDMMKELELTSLDDNEFYVRESRDMVTVIQSLLSAGHKFETNEIVNLILEPGICSIDDEIDGSCIVRARGLPWQSSDQDIAKFFRGLNVAKGGVALCLSPLGRRNGEALIRFISQEHRDMALKRHKHHITSRYIEVYRASGEDFLAVAGGASNEAQAFLSKGAQVIIRMRGLPYDCTAKQVLDFFTTGENPCDVLDGVDGVLFVKKPDGRATGDAFVLFAKEEDAPHALSRHRESIGQRYIELFRSTTAEVQQVLNRSMDPKTYEPNPPPLIAQLPPVHQVPLLPQRVITSGTKKSCIRLRGLPYEAQVEHILHFLDDFAKNIIYQGVHMVFNSQGQPSGEAFIQMDSEESARVCALQKHNQFMIFGKKYRYIEVFQCSGDDMNLVLNGGLQSPVTQTKPALLSPGGTLVAPPFGAFPHFGHPATIFPPPHQRTHPTGPTFYQPQLVYWPYPSPPVSPTTYYAGPAPPAPPPTSHHHVTSNLIHQNHHQALIPVDFIPASPAAYHHATHHPVTNHQHHHHQQHGHQHHQPRHQNQQQNHHYSSNQHHHHHHHPQNQHQHHNPHQLPVSPSLPQSTQIQQSSQLQPITVTSLNTSTSSKLTGSKQFSDNNASINTQTNNISVSSNHTTQQHFHSMNVAVIPTTPPASSTSAITTVHLTPPILNGNTITSSQPQSPPVINAAPPGAAPSVNGIITNGTQPSTAYIHSAAAAAVTGTPIAAPHILTIDTSNTTNISSATALALEKYSGSQLHHHTPQPFLGQLAPAQLTGRLLSPTFLATANYHHHQHQGTVAAAAAAGTAFNATNHYVELYIA